VKTRSLDDELTCTCWRFDVEMVCSPAAFGTQALTSQRVRVQATQSKARSGTVSVCSRRAQQRLTAQSVATSRVASFTTARQHVRAKWSTTGRVRRQRAEGHLAHRTTRGRARGMTEARLPARKRVPARSPRFQPCRPRRVGQVLTLACRASQRRSQTGSHSQRQQRHVIQLSPVPARRRPRRPAAGCCN
jgi:hypothetical protein